MIKKTNTRTTSFQCTTHTHTIRRIYIIICAECDRMENEHLKAERKKRALETKRNEKKNAEKIK